MKFTLPTQKAPNKETKVGELKISPGRRVKIENEGMCMYWDSMIVEFTGHDWNIVNEWIAFHNIIFDDHVSLDWYESQNFNTSSKFTDEGECSYLVDYSNISGVVYRPDIYPEILNYEDLYKKYISQSEENKALVKNYFNSLGVARFVSTQRQIRNDSFWRILVSFSIIESILGEAPNCSENVTCSIHGNLYPHKKMSSQDWTKQRLLEIITDPKIADEYFAVIWEVRQKIRHQTVHQGVIPESRYVLQDEREIVWDWAKTTENWGKDSTALSNLENHIKEITKSLILNRLFNLKLFPVLRPLHSVRIVSK